MNHKIQKECVIFCGFLGFINFLLEVYFITKSNFHSSPNKWIKYCQYFFLITLDPMMRGVDFLNVFSLKIKIFTKYSTVIVN